MTEKMDRFERGQLYYSTIEPKFLNFEIHYDIACMYLGHEPGLQPAIR